MTEHTSGKLSSISAPIRPASFKWKSGSELRGLAYMGSYFIRKLANNLSEPQRSYALNAIDRAIQFWRGK